MAVDRPRRALRRHRPEPRADPGGGSRENGSQGCCEACAVLSRRGSHRRLGARCRDGSLAGSGARAGGGQAGSAAGAASREQVLAPARPPPTDGLRAWGVKHALWLNQQQFELPTLQVVYDEYRATLGVLADRVARLERAIDAALTTLAPTQQALVSALATLRGVQQVTAATLVSELGTLRRFASARQLMGYAGLVPREHSSGSGVRRGAITKTGNAHLRRVLVEAAWAYRHRANTASATLRVRQLGQPAPVIAVATKAQHRLCPRYRRLAEQGKVPLAVATVIARELLGFIWAIGYLIEPQPTAVPPLGAVLSA